MSYEVIARKWRPKQFCELVGQDHVSTTLINAIDSDRVAHAYLFVGPRGTGKTTTARILAKALNCEKGPSPVPCDECDSCKEVMAGHHLDVLEIDGASNNGVEQVRDLRENIWYAPSRGVYKVYIIDEVHMLSLAAFNALLKTLEEPPKHVKFIFATTEPQKVPATILSRCQRFDLKKIPTKAMVKRLEVIAASEQIKIESEAIRAIARSAQGGLRDAESALDQIISFKGKNIVESDVLDVFGLISRITLEELARSVLEGDLAKALQLVNELDGNGKDLQRVVIELLEHFRNLLIYAHIGTEIQSLDVTDEQCTVLEAQAKLVDESKLVKMIEWFMDADYKMRYALSKRTLLETTIIKSGRMAESVGIEQVISAFNQLKENLSGSVSTEVALPEQEPSSLGKKKEAVASNSQQEVQRPAPEASPVKGETDLATVQRTWYSIIDRIGHALPLAKNYLRDARPVAEQGDTMVIGFDPEFAEHLQRVNTPRNLQVMQKTLSNFLNRNIHVTFKILDDAPILDEPKRLATKKQDQEPKIQENREGVRTRDEWVKQPLVRKTLEMFHGDIIDIR